MAQEWTKIALGVSAAAPSFDPALKTIDWRSFK